MIPTCRCINTVANLNIGVDSGMIIISDLKGYDLLQSDYEDVISVTKVNNGTYKVRYEMADTWNGKVEGEGIVKITSGWMVVADPSYILKFENEEWMKWVESLYKGGDINKARIHNKSGLKKKNLILIDSMGGDGIFNFEMEIKKVK